MKRNSRVFLALFIVLIVLTGCSDKPGEDIVKQAVQEELSKGVPERWMKAMVVGGDVNITSMNIVEWGDFNEKGKYWPVKVKILGSATLQTPFGNAPVRKFDEVGEFRFFKDDYDKWQWRFMKPQLFG
jgi:hypothetical protein